MTGYNAPSFQERAESAKQARQKALDKLRDKAPVDQAVLDQRAAAHRKREEAIAEKSRLKREAIAQAKIDKAAKLAAVPVAPPKAPELTEAEKKAARDARYAARKKRK